MKARRNASGSLIVTHRSVFIRALIVGFAAGMVVPLITSMPFRQLASWMAVCLVFEVALLAADERTTFVFDARDHVLRWSRSTPFRRESGEVPFTAITGLSIERAFVAAAPSRGRGGARRLVLLTSAAPIPFTTAFWGFGTDAMTVGREVQHFLGEAADGVEPPLRAP